MTKRLYKVMVCCYVKDTEYHSFKTNREYVYIIQAKNRSQALRKGYRQTLKKACYTKSEYISDTYYISVMPFNINLVKTCIERDGCYTV